MIRVGHFYSTRKEKKEKREDKAKFLHITFCPKFWGTKSLKLSIHPNDRYNYLNMLTTKIYVVLSGLSDDDSMF